MSAPPGMETYDARLESFSKTRSATKKRASNAKGSKNATKWPHHSPSPAQLARAGFYYDPSASSPDNVTCAGCLKSLDGWEAEDDPVKEHVAYSSSCGIAVIAQLEQELEAGSQNIQNPTSEEMNEARKATFGDMWPHEGKRGWVCKTQKMAEAGWYYCPTADSDDFVKCAYCSLSLDGWEPKDKPFEEHQRRSADCIFFGFSSTSNAKATKVKKGRSSKASRLSTQSVDIAATDDLPMHDETLDGDASILSTATDMTTASSATTKAKKGGKASKGRAKGKAAVKAQDEPIPEPEDDSFDVKVAEEPKPVARGRKRTSDQVDQGDVAPQAKRRGTRARSSTVKPEPVLVPGNHEDRQMTDAEDAILYPATKEVKGRKRASSTTRKASNVSTASKAPLRSALPADTEIEAALEADLDRPLSDEERSAEQAEGRSLASAKTDNNKAPASTASVRQANKTSMEFQGESALINTQMEVDDTMNTVDEPATQINMPKGRQVKQGTKKIAADDIVNSQMVESQASESTAEVSSKPARKGRQASRQTSRQKAKQPRTRPIQPETTVDGRNGGGIYTAPDEAGHIPDVSQTSVKRGKQASIGATEGRKPKNSNGASQNIEHVAGPASDMPSMPGAFVEAEEIEDAAEEATVQPAKPKGRGRPKGKKNSAVTNSKEALQAAEILEPIEMPRVRESIQATTEELLEDEPEATKQMSPSPAVSPPPVVIEVETSEPVLNERENQLEAEAEPSIVPQATPKRSSPARQIPSPTPSPQSSDAENQPPSSRPSQTRPPLGQVSPNKRVQIVATTPTGGSKKASSSLQSSIPWTAVDVEDILLGSAKSNKENGPRSTAIELSSHEREMTVEEWIMQNAKQSEDRLRNECERMVAKFENEGVRAMKVLEGINTSDG